MDTGVFKYFGFGLLMSDDDSEYILFVSFSFAWLELSVLLLLNWKHRLLVCVGAVASGALRLSSMLALFTSPLLLPPTLVCPASMSSNATEVQNPTLRAGRRGRGQNRSSLLQKVRCM